MLSKLRITEILKIKIRLKFKLKQWMKDKECKNNKKEGSHQAPKPI